MDNLTEAKAPSVSVIVVTFNSSSTLASCLNSIPPSAEVVVVDQNSSDRSAQMASQIRPDARVIRAGNNRGFGAGCNLGAANCTGTVLVFLNPDAYLALGSLETLAKAVINQNALVGAKILDRDGIESVSARNSSRMLVDLITEVLPYRFARGVLARDIPLTDCVYRTGGPVGYVYGSCMAVSASNFWRVGGFDERYFLYHEEETLGRQLEAIGVGVILEPRAVITHLGKVSTSQSPEFAVSQQYRSKVLYHSTYSSAASSLVFSSSLWVLLRLMALATPARRLMGIRARQDRSWYLAAARGVVSGRRKRIVQSPVTVQAGLVEGMVTAQAPETP